MAAGFSRADTNASGELVHVLRHLPIMAGSQSVSWDRIETSAAGIGAATCGRMTRILPTLTAAIAIAAVLGPARATTMWPDQLTEEQPAPTAPPAASIRKPVRSLQPRAIVGQKHVPRGPKQHVKMAGAPQEGGKPHGPLVIAVSITRQHLRIYDADGLFAESPVSTGMRGHPTPMGVFSIIQKSKYHRSNIYSGAPMPYMQRITWSGVAMHAGVLPGYPASHGCIRMPMAFAVKLWGWSKLGARVIVAPDDIAPPAGIAHPVLVTHAAPPQPAPPVSPPATPGAPAAQTEPGARISHANGTASLVPDGATVHSDNAGLLTDRTLLRPSISGQVQVADADANLPSASRDQGAVATDTAPQAGGASAERQPEPTPAAAEPAATAAVAATTSSDPAASAVTATTTAPENSKAPAPSAEPGKTTAQEVAHGPHPGDGAAKPAPADSAAVANPKDASPAPTAAPAEAGSPASRRNGHVAVLISRKAGRLYVRQNFEPWFDVPIVIAQGDHPLGTHVFTAAADAAAPGGLRWSVVSLPQMPRRRDAADESRLRSKRAAAVVESEPAPPPAPADVLNRLTIPADVTAKLAAALAPGGSIVVSDQGPGDETGLGTDFIVPLR
ncbi:MAG: L,D-transpeptidase [Xanthobacteraceae bacterium]|nr:L,D-transpeptidase [Xanthobacteraceae bacterium]